MNLLTRDEFREAVFRRDNHRCVVCGLPAQDAHHILERRLFPDGGYYLDNGSSLCGFCHINAEATQLTCEQIRQACGITDIVLPPHMYGDQRYDKWGNIINANGTRTPGELFEDESVQKILGQGGVLPLFTPYRKYPRTYHLPWSPGVTKDDRVLDDLSCFANREIVITEKMDGENTTIYSDGYCHARSLDSGGHPSRTRVKALAAEIGCQLPAGWRLCGENLQAKHSIFYDDLAAYFLVFSIWDQRNRCLSWADTVEWSQLLGLHMVTVLFAGELVKPTDHLVTSRHYPEPVVRTGELAISGDVFTDCAARSREGYVVRVASEFSYSDFRRSVAKYVRANHVQTQHNWMMQKVEYNELKKPGAS